MTTSHRYGFLVFMRKLILTLAIVGLLAACRPNPLEVPIHMGTRVQPAVATPTYCPKDGTVYTVGSCTLDPSVMPSGLPVGSQVYYHASNFEAAADYPPNTNPDGSIAMDCPDGVTDYHLCTAK